MLTGISKVIKWLKGRLKHDEIAGMTGEGDLGVSQV